MEPADRMVSMAPHDHGRDPRSTGECVRSDERRVPGDVAMWAFILAELLVFALFFSAYAWFRHDERALFAAEGYAGLSMRGRRAASMAGMKCETLRVSS